MGGGKQHACVGMCTRICTTCRMRCNFHVGSSGPQNHGSASSLVRTITFVGLCASAAGNEPNPVKTEAVWVRPLSLYTLAAY